MRHRETCGPFGDWIPGSHSLLACLMGKFLNIWKHMHTWWMIHWYILVSQRVMNDITSIYILWTVRNRFDFQMTELNQRDESISIVKPQLPTLEQFQQLHRQSCKEAELIGSVVLVFQKRYLLLTSSFFGCGTWKNAVFNTIGPQWVVLHWGYFIILQVFPLKTIIDIWSIHCFTMCPLDWNEGLFNLV